MKLAIVILRLYAVYLRKLWVPLLLGSMAIVQISLEIVSQ